MTLKLQLNSADEIALQKKAQALGMDVTAYALRLLRSAAKRPALDEVLAPIRAKFLKDGITDDQVIEQYEIEKHAATAARHNKPFDE